MTLYMAVTPDKYELPLAVETSLDDMAEVFGTTKLSVSTAISRNNDGRRRGVKFVKVEVYM